MKFIASRLSEGNKLFPAEIHLESNSLTVKIPGFLSGNTQHFSYDQISNISINTPMVGFSTITFHASGTYASAHGFTKDEVKQIKLGIEDNKNKQYTQNTFVPTQHSFMPVQNSNDDNNEPIEVIIKRLEIYEREKERAEVIKIQKEKYTTTDGIRNIIFENDSDSVINEIDTLFNKFKAFIKENKKQRESLGDIMITHSIIEKIKEGLKKLNRLGAAESIIKAFEEDLLEIQRQKQNFDQLLKKQRIDKNKKILFILLPLIAITLFCLNSKSVPDIISLLFLGLTFTIGYFIFKRPELLPIKF